MGENHADTGSNGAQGKPQAPVEQQQPPAMQPQSALVRFEPQTATEAWQLAKYYGQSNLLPAALKSVGDVFVTIMAGRDFGWSPMQSLRGIYVVEGKPSLSADAMVSIAKKSGLCEYFRLVKSDATEAIYETKRKGDPEPVRMGFTIAEAETAGLLNKKGPWHTYRARMLRNRAKSVLCKEVYEDLFLGTWEEDEAIEVAELRGLPTGAPVPPAARAPEGTAASRIETVKAAQATVEQPAEEERNPDELCEEFRQAMLAAATPVKLTEIAAKVKAAHESRLLTDEHRKTLLAVFGQRSKDLVPAPAGAP